MWKRIENVSVIKLESESAMKFIITIDTDKKKLCVFHANEHLKGQVLILAEI